MKVRDRRLAVAGILLVNNPGPWSAIAALVAWRRPSRPVGLVGLALWLGYWAFQARRWRPTSTACSSTDTSGARARAGAPVSLKEAIFERGFASWLAPINASLLFAVSFVVLWYLILFLVERRGWILKI